MSVVPAANANFAPAATVSGWTAACACETVQLLLTTSSPFAIAGQPERPLKTNGTYGAASPKSMDVPGPNVAGPSNAGR